MMFEQFQNSVLFRRFHQIECQIRNDVMTAFRPCKAGLSSEQERKKQAENATKFQHGDFLVKVI